MTWELHAFRSVPRDRQYPLKHGSKKSEFEAYVDDHKLQVDNERVSLFGVTRTDVAIAFYQICCLRETMLMTLTEEDLVRQAQTVVCLRSRKPHAGSRC
jgi:hypothetical protein